MEYFAADFYGKATVFAGFYHERLFIRPCKYMRPVEDNCGTPDKNLSLKVAINEQ